MKDLGSIYEVRSLNLIAINISKKENTHDIDLKTTKIYNKMKKENTIISVLNIKIQLIVRLFFFFWW